VTGNIHKVLGSIRKKAHYKGRIAIVNYYSLDYSSPAINAQSELLTGVQDAAAKPSTSRSPAATASLGTAPGSLAGASVQQGCSPA
jgi:hypothetical protein